MNKKTMLIRVGIGLLVLLNGSILSCTRIRQRLTSPIPSPSASPAPMSLMTVTPNYAPVVGGIKITLMGTGFVQGITVTVGGNACTSVTWISGTDVTCIIPPGTLGLTQVVATNPDGGKAVAPFTYGLPSMGITSGGRISISNDGKGRRMISVFRQVSRTSTGARPKSGNIHVVPGLEAFMDPAAK